MARSKKMKIKVFTSLFLLAFILAGLSVVLAIFNSAKVRFSPSEAACKTCSFSGYKCSGKNATVCSGKCVSTVGSCPSNLSCNSSSTKWWCYDNCVEGKERCPSKTSGDSAGWIQKCSNDSWVNSEQGPVNCCGCNSSGDCYFSC